MPALEQVKVSDSTRRRIRIGAAIDDCTMGEFVERAVGQFLVTHADEIKAGIEHAREVLLLKGTDG